MPSSKLPNTITNSDDYQAAVKSLETLSLGNQAAVVAICNAARYGWLAAFHSRDWSVRSAGNKLKILGAIAKDLKSKLPEDCRSYRQYFTVNAIAMGCAIDRRFATNPDAKYPRSPDVLRAAIPLFALAEDAEEPLGLLYMFEITHVGPNDQEILDDAAVLTYDAFKSKYGPDVWGQREAVAGMLGTYATSWRPPTARKQAPTSLPTTVQSPNYTFDSVTDIVNWIIRNTDKLGEDEVSRLHEATA